MLSDDVFKGRHGGIVSYLGPSFQLENRSRVWYGPVMTTPACAIRCIKPQMIRRYAAYAFDWTLVGLAVEVFPGNSLLVGLAGLVIVGALYFSLMEASSYQGTIGKWLVGLRVEDEAGYRLEMGQSFARFFSGTASWATLNIGHLMAGWRPDGRAMHDLIAKTRVCQEKNLDHRHNVAVVALLLVHVVSMAIAVVMAVNRAVEQLAQAGVIQSM